MEDFPRFLPRFLDKAAESYGDETLVMVPLDEYSPFAGYRALNLRKIKQASDRVAWWLDKHLGPDVRIFSYCGKRDIRWSLLWLAAMRTGRTVLVYGGQKAHAQCTDLE